MKIILLKRQVFQRIVSIVLCFILISTHVEQGYAQAVTMPAPGQMLNLSATYQPMVLSGIKVDPARPFQLDFLVDKGSRHPERSEGSLVGDPRLRGDDAISSQELKAESRKLIQYFLAALTTPDQDFWVNLSPYEADRIVPDAFGQTAMGRDLLAQDYLLKQITASLLHPDNEHGQRFWDKVYAQAFEMYGTTEIPVETFHKVWIVPAVAKVYEGDGVAYVTKAELKVLMEEDYLARRGGSETLPEFGGRLETRPYETNLMRDVIIPALEAEVNTGTHFAPLRQIYHSLILATWYKQKLKNSILAQVYADQNKAQEGRHSEERSDEESQRSLPGRQAGFANAQDDELTIDEIYQQYVQSFKEGAYDFVKANSEDVVIPASEPGSRLIEIPHQVRDDDHKGGEVARRYFSGGKDFAQIGNILEADRVVPDTFSANDHAAVFVDLRSDTALPDSAMNASLDDINTVDAFINHLRRVFSRAATVVDHWQGDDPKELSLLVNEITQGEFYHNVDAVGEAEMANIIYQLNQLRLMDISSTAKAVRNFRKVRANNKFLGAELLGLGLDIRQSDQKVLDYFIAVLRWDEEKAAGAVMNWQQGQTQTSSLVDEIVSGRFEKAKGTGGEAVAVLIHRLRKLGLMREEQETEALTHYGTYVHKVRGKLLELRRADGAMTAVADGAMMAKRQQFTKHGFLSESFRQSLSFNKGVLRVSGKEQTRLAETGSNYIYLVDDEEGRRFVLRIVKGLLNQFRESRSGFKLVGELDRTAHLLDEGVITSGKSEKHFFIVTEYVEGEKLSKVKMTEALFQSLRSNLLDLLSRHWGMYDLTPAQYVVGKIWRNGLPPQAGSKKGLYLVDSEKIKKEDGFLATYKMFLGSLSAYHRLWGKMGYRERLLSFFDQELMLHLYLQNGTLSYAMMNFQLDRIFQEIVGLEDQLKNLLTRGLIEVKGEVGPAKVKRYGLSEAGVERMKVYPEGRDGAMTALPSREQILSALPESERKLILADIVEREPHYNQTLVDGWDVSPENVAEMIAQYGRNEEAVPSGQGRYGLSIVLFLHPTENMLTALGVIKDRLKTTAAYKKGVIRFLPDENIHHTLTAHQGGEHGMKLVYQQDSIPEDIVERYRMEAREALSPMKPFHLYIEGVGIDGKKGKGVLRGYVPRSFKAIESITRVRQFPKIDFNFFAIVGHLEKEEEIELTRVMEELKRVPIGLRRVNQLNMVHHQEDVLINNLRMVDLPLRNRLMLSEERKARLVDMLNRIPVNLRVAGVLDDERIEVYVKRLEKLDKWSATQFNAFLDEVYRVIERAFITYYHSRGSVPEGLMEEYAVRLDELKVDDPDGAMTATTQESRVKPDTGGVDLTADWLNVQIESDGVMTAFQLDDAMIAEMRQNITRLEPVIMKIAPTTPRIFLNLP